MENKSLTKNDIKNAFELYSTEMQGSNAHSKLNASGEMLSLLSNYLSQQISDIDTTALLILLEELANISGGNEPEFVKSNKSNLGRPVKLGDNIRYAAIVAAIEILTANGYSLKDAVRKATELSGYDSTRLRQIRKEFRENKRPVIAIKFMWEQIRKPQELQLDPRNFAVSLIKTAIKKGG